MHVQNYAWTDVACIAFNANEVYWYSVHVLTNIFAENGYTLFISMIY
jgi:hypothetical protein